MFGSRVKILARRIHPRRSTLSQACRYFGTQFLAIPRAPLYRWLTLGTAVTGTFLLAYKNPPTVVSAQENPNQKLFVAASTGDLQDLKDNVKKLAGTDHKRITTLVNTRHEFGWTLLGAAAVNDHLAVVQWLVENGADINLGDEYYLSPHDTTDRLIRCEQAREAQFSNQIKPRLDCRGWTPLHYACAFGNPKIVKYLLEKGANARVGNARGIKPEAYIETSNEKGRLIVKIFEDYKDNQEILKKRERVNNPMEDRLSKNMVGQVMPIYSVASALRRRQNGWHDEDKPLVLLFLGSSGVGKTMLAKCIAEIIMKDHHNGFIRIDMSEFQSKHEVSKFIGAPPGYIGYDEGGQLTEKLRKCPQAVVLLDEVEKAHPDILNIMLQVFDEGRLTDGKGKTVDCRNATFIMTSNLVQEQIGQGPYKLRPKNKLVRGPKGDLTSETQSELAQVRNETNQFLRRVVQPILKQHFKRDEFLGRINEVVVFHLFSSQDLEEIVLKELDKWAVRALKRHNIAVKWDPKLVHSLTLDYNESYGFRSIKHEVEKRVINIMAAAYEREEIKDGSQILLKLADDRRTVLIVNE